MRTTTIGQVLVNNALPRELRNYSRVFDKKGAGELFNRLATEHPDAYKDVLQQLMHIGKDYAYYTGGNTFSLDHLRPTQAARAARDELKRQIGGVLADRTLSPEQRNARIVELTNAVTDKLTNSGYEEALAAGNPFATQVLSGSRGNKANLRGLISFDGIAPDHHGNPIPVPILHSYSEGLGPGEYQAAAYGARKGLVDTKLGTQRSGYAAKQLTQLTHRLLVSGLDDDDDPDNQNRYGFPTTVDDPENSGSLLAVDAGPYKRNTILTPKILADLKRAGVNDLLVRSPIAGGPVDGGVYSRDLGLRERRTGLAPVGDYVGMAAAQAIAEKLTQASLGSKHGGGARGTGPTGFALINQLIQNPENFTGGATHSTADGIVQEIRSAPQGGSYILVNNEEHYSPPGAKIRVKTGDSVEAGDMMTDGIPNGAEIIKHKGVGEGRRYFVDTLRGALKGSGIDVHRRNIELVARGLINHVRVTDPWDDYAPDDVIPYNVAAARWQPRPDARAVAPKQAVGRYLEAPTLHYTVGTRIQPSMLPTFERYGVGSLQTHDDPPPWEPEMVRAQASISTDPDWMTRMLGSGQKGSLLDSVHRGGTSDTSGTSFVPALASGTGFGQQGLTKGW